MANQRIYFAVSRERALAMSTNRKNLSRFIDSRKMQERKAQIEVISIAVDVDGLYSAFCRRLQSINFGMPVTEKLFKEEKDNG